jgi:hypothetical protein
MSSQYQTVAEIEAVVQGFETCSMDKDDFSHARHLTVALWYLHQNSIEEAADRMRAGLFKFLNHHQVPIAKYNETITLFWLKAVYSFSARQVDSGLPAAEQKLPAPTTDLVCLANKLAQSFSTSRLVFEYYSESLINSEKAKSSWLEPDLKALDF